MGSGALGGTTVSVPGPVEEAPGVPPETATTLSKTLILTSAKHQETSTNLTNQPKHTKLSQNTPGVASQSNNTHLE